MFLSLTWMRPPSLEAFLAPVDLSNAALLETLCALATELVSSFSGNGSAAPFFQRANYRSLIRKIQVISTLLDAFSEVGLLKLNSAVFLCLKELYPFLYRSKILLDYVKWSSKIWLLIQSNYISCRFYDLNEDFSTLVDVLPLNEINMSNDVKEQIELLRKQSRTPNPMIDDHDDLLRRRLYYFLNEFEKGGIPNKDELQDFLVENLRVCSVIDCRVEIEFLEEQIVNHEGDYEPTVLILNGFMALIRYCRFLLFRFEDEEGELGKWKHMNSGKGFNRNVIADTFTSIPKDFCCPITLELMKDPVVVSTGQTYDQESISRWIEEGHCNCPKTGQILIHKELVPNRALKNLIYLWCMGNGIPYDRLENVDSSSESVAATLLSKAVNEATRATTDLLVEQLAKGSMRAKTVAAREIRLLAKTGRKNRACIADAGAIPLLKALLLSSDAFAQENSITALLNLSIYEVNKSRIMDVNGCLGAIVGVLRLGITVEAGENAAATLFSLSAVHDYKKLIAGEDGALEALAGLLRDGTPRGQKDAVAALFNLSTHTENCARMIDSGAVTALVGSLGSEVVSEEAAGALALIVRQPKGADAVGKEEMGISGLIGMMRCGTPRGKENAVAALLELCRGGGAATTERVVKAPALAGLLQSLLFTGTKRARRKAASLARVFQRSENTSLHFGGLGVGYAFAGDSALREASFAGEVSLPVPITVPVL